MNLRNPSTLLGDLADLKHLQLGNGIKDEVAQVVRRNPIAQVGRQEKRCVVINIDEAGTRTKPDAVAPLHHQGNQQRIGSFPQEKYLAACRDVS